MVKCPKCGYNLTFTKKELVVAKLAAIGLLNKQIAGHLGNTEQTIKNHIVSILRKLNLSTRVNISMKLIENQLVTMEELKELEREHEGELGHDKI
jgi:DNA-binding NarL/FixJ family response regulator